MDFKIRLSKSLRNFSSYVPDKVNYKIRLNSNESPFNESNNFLLNLVYKRVFKSSSINRYPDSSQAALKKEVSQFYGFKSNQILFGNGSDELILYLLLALTGKTSKVLYLEPSFSMYKILTKALGLKGIGVSLNSDFSLNLAKVLLKIKKEDPDLIFIASPNNPTGNSFDKSDIIEIIKSSKGLVVIDEAYSDYSSDSCLSLLKKNKNLLIMKTMSKIGFAALRLGYLIGDKQILNAVNKIRLPYNISSISQLVATDFFKNSKLLEKQIEVVKKERSKVFNFLSRIQNLKVFESDSNFILFEVKKSKRLFELLKKENIIVKNFPKNNKLENCLRVSIGLPKENKRFMSVVSSFLVK